MVTFFATVSPERILSRLARNAHLNQRSDSWEERERITVDAFRCFPGSLRFPVYREHIKGAHKFQQYSDAVGSAGVRLAFNLHHSSVGDPSNGASRQESNGNWGNRETFPNYRLPIPAPSLSVGVALETNPREGWGPRGASVP